MAQHLQTFSLLSLVLFFWIAPATATLTPRTSGPVTEYWEPEVRPGLAVVCNDASTDEEGRSLAVELAASVQSPYPHACIPGNIKGNLCQGPEGSYCCDAGYTCCNDNPGQCCPFVPVAPVPPPGFPGCPDTSPKLCYTIDATNVFCCKQGEACGGTVCIPPPPQEPCPPSTPNQCFLTTGRGAYCCQSSETCCNNQCCSTRLPRSPCPYNKPITCQNALKGSQFCCTTGQTCCNDKCCTYDSLQNVIEEDPGTPADGEGTPVDAPAGAPVQFFPVKPGAIAPAAADGGP